MRLLPTALIGLCLLFQNRNLRICALSHRSLFRPAEFHSTALACCAVQPGVQGRVQLRRTTFRRSAGVVVCCTALRGCTVSWQPVRTIRPCAPAQCSHQPLI
ncbi:unnamed protein product [Periconia digitata]|uniref:Uncharacterized protein n=1 Tax=Periconia digitata TaxID=1303443 RepID=A0A9W4UJ07_9PLEO|nr:unnamed protein product [Periconia digitata]